MIECWLFLPAVVLLGGEQRLLLYPFAALWRAVAGGDDGVTLYDLLAGTRVQADRHDAANRVAHACGGGRA
jgi:hypothetical protein